MNFGGKPTTLVIPCKILKISEVIWMEYKSNYNRKLVADLYDFKIDEFMPNKASIEN